MKPEQKAQEIFNEVRLYTATDYDAAQITSIVALIIRDETNNCWWEQVAEETPQTQPENIEDAIQYIRQLDVIKLQRSINTIRQWVERR
jgi:hypothetical protein